MSCLMEWNQITPNHTTHKQVVTRHSTVNFVKLQFTIPSLEVNRCNWPDGPTNLQDLFLWAQHNAVTLLKTSPQASAAVDRFKKVMQKDIFVFDCYSGMGTGGFTLHVQHSHMIRQGT